MKKQKQFDETFAYAQTLWNHLKVLNHDKILQRTLQPQKQSQDSSITIKKILFLGKLNLQFILKRFNKDFHENLILFASYQLTIDNYFTLFKLITEYLENQKDQDKKLRQLIRQPKGDFKQSMLNIIIHFSFLIKEKQSVTNIRKFYIETPLKFNLEVKIILKIFLQLSFERLNASVISQFFIPFLKVSNNIDHMHQQCLEAAIFVNFKGSQKQKIVQEMINHNLQCKQCFNKGILSVLKYLKHISQPNQIKKVLNKVLYSEKIILIHYIQNQIISDPQKYLQYKEQIMGKLSVFKNSEKIKNSFNILEVITQQTILKLKSSQRQINLNSVNFQSLIEEERQQLKSQIKKKISKKTQNDDTNKNQDLIKKQLSCLINLQIKMQGKWQVLLQYYKKTHKKIFQNTIQQNIQNFVILDQELQSNIIKMFVDIIQEEQSSKDEFYLKNLSSLIVKLPLIQKLKNILNDSKSKKKQIIIKTLKDKFQDKPEIVKYLNNL